METAPPTIFSRKRSAAKWARARRRAASENSATFLIDNMAEDTIERLGFMKLTPRRALIIGDHTHQVPAYVGTTAEQVSAGELGLFEEEQPGPPDSFDLIVHMLGLGMVNDLPGAFIHARNSLTKDGLFLAAFPGAGSLTALRQISLAADGDRPSPRMHPMIDSSAAAALLQRAGFKRQVVDSYTLSVRYSQLSQLISDLRDHGLTSSLATVSPPFTKASLERASHAFDALREDDGKVTETFEILTLTAWKS